jgi:hypothetical protein
MIANERCWAGGHFPSIQEPLQLGRAGRADIRGFIVDMLPPLFVRRRINAKDEERESGHYERHEDMDRKEEWWR